MTAARPHGLAVVSGASRGLGWAVAHELANRGLHVLAGVRQEADGESLRRAGIEPVMLDITNEDDVARLAQRVAQDDDGRPLRVLINNAGGPVNAPYEVLPLPEWRRQFDLNLFGHVAVTQALLPSLIDAGGTVVNISSAGALMGTPLYGAYSSAKAALEVSSDVLRRELRATNVHVVVIQAGNIETGQSPRGFSAGDDLRAGMSPEQHARYDTIIRATGAMARDTRRTTRPEDAARRVADAALAQKPRARYRIGSDATMTYWLSRLTSDRRQDRLLEGVQKQYADRKE